MTAQQPIATQRRKVSATSCLNDSCAHHMGRAVQGKPHTLLSIKPETVTGEEGISYASSTLSAVSKCMSTHLTTCRQEGHARMRPLAYQALSQDFHYLMNLEC